MLQGMNLNFKLIDSIQEVAAQDWNACAGDHPFVQHEFLSALEVSGALGPKRGVLPRYALLNDSVHGLVACAPAMLMWGSVREYGPEIRWLKAGLQANCFAWPKFQVGLPFFPVMGPKLLVRPDQHQHANALRATLIKILMQLGQREDRKSVFNILHIDKPAAIECKSHGAMLSGERHSMWFNHGFSSRINYLSTLTKHTRENFHRDRRLAQSHGLEFKILHGHDLSAELLADYYEGHRRVCERYTTQPWLPATAYVSIAQSIPQAVMLMGYFRGGRLIAGIMYLLGNAEQTLYALQWSEMEKLDGIAMDLICHRPIDYAIEHGIAKLDSGLAAPHKSHRGWLTVPVYHAHWFYTDELKTLANLEGGSPKTPQVVNVHAKPPHAHLETVFEVLPSKSAWSGGSTHSKSKRLMPFFQDSTGKFIVGFDFPSDAKPGGLKAWLDLLDDQLPTYSTHLLARSGADEGTIWLSNVLTLTLALIHVLRIPLFDPIEIFHCHQPSVSAEKWQGICRLPNPALIPTRVLEGVLKAAFKLAVWATRADANSLSDREHFYQAILKDVLKVFPEVKPKGKSTFEVLKVAHRLGIPSIAMPGGVFQLGWGSCSRRFDRSSTDHDSAMGVRWTQDKRLTTQLLRTVGLPCPVHNAVSFISHAKEAADRIGYPVVVKPTDLDRGEGVSVDVMPESLEAAFNDAFKRSPKKMVLIEQQVPGVCHRLFIVAGKLLYAVKRLPIGVYADGRSTIRDLVEAECEVQQWMPPWKRSGIRPLDDLALYMLNRQGLEPTTVPDIGKFIALRRIESTSWGGVDEEVTNTIHPDNVSAATAATNLLGLEVAGVDMISRDISLPWYLNNAIINEVNFAPLLGGGEISRRYIPNYLKQLVKSNGRIPVEVFVGGPAALETAKARQVEMAAQGLAVWLSSCKQTLAPNSVAPSLGTPEDGRQTHSVALPLQSLHARVSALVLSHDVEALLLVVHDDELLRTGVPLDRVDVVHLVDFNLVTAGGEKPSALSSHRVDEVVNFLRAWIKD